jgi:hypothetical protein
VQRHNLQKVTSEKWTKYKKSNIYEYNKCVCEIIIIMWNLHSNQAKNTLVIALMQATFLCCQMILKRDERATWAQMIRESVPVV